VIGSVVVERGPGNASNLGQATFGGSINLFSRDLQNERVFSPYASFGSWNTQLYGARYDTGTLTDFGDSRLSLNYQKLTSDGYRTYSKVEGENYSLKWQKPIGTSTLITVDLNRNSNWYYQPDKDNGLTLAQVASYGKTYVLDNNPNKANYWQYNRTDKSTDFNYIRVQSELSSVWSIDNTTYYYNYTNNTLTASNAGNADAGLGSVKNAAGATVTNQMPGYRKINEYWVSGNIFKATAKLGPGLLRTGLWTESADTHRARYELNLFTMGANYSQAAVAGVYSGINNVTYEQYSGWHNWQPFAEFEWKVNDRLSITPGLKYVFTQLRVNAPVNQTARSQAYLAEDFKKTLPFLTTNFKINPTWSAYAQYAQGMLVPDISSYQSSNAGATNVAPQTSTNYQVGVVHKSDRLTFDADLYWIDFDNKIAVVPGTSAQPVYYNQGGVTYRGIEGEVTYALDRNFFVYANGSLNSAASKTTGLQIANAPRDTEALGLLYRSGPWNASVMYKRVGNYYALDDQGYRMNAYSTTDLSFGYTFGAQGQMLKKVRVQFGIYNLFNKTDAISVNPVNTTAGTAAYGTVNAGDTFLFQPGRSYMASIRADI
jgi:iron complex outermembrane receptor protein